MQPLNFISTLSPKAQRSLRVWYRCTLILISLLCGCIGVIQTLQLINLFTLRAEEKRLRQQHMLDAHLLNTLDTLQARHKKSEANVASLKQLVAKQQRLTSQLKTIKKAIPLPALESYTYNAQDLTITFTCSSPQQATATLQALKHNLTDVRELRLISLQPYKQATRTSYTAHVKGSML